MIRLVLITSGLSDGIDQAFIPLNAVRDDMRLNQSIARSWKSILVEAGVLFNPFVNAFSRLDKLPDGFAAFTQPRSNGKKHSIIISGHPSGKMFRSDHEFLDHWVHLELYGPNGRCPCCLCTRRKRSGEERCRLRVLLPVPIPQPRVRAVDEQVMAAPIVQQPLAETLQQPTTPQTGSPGTDMTQMIFPLATTPEYQITAQTPTTIPQLLNSSMLQSSVPPAPPSRYHASSYQQSATPAIEYGRTSSQSIPAFSDDILMGHNVWTHSLQKHLDEAIARTSPETGDLSMVVAPAGHATGINISNEEYQRQLDEALTIASQEVWALYR